MIIMLFEKLPENEKLLIEKYIDTYACEGKVSRTASLEHILRIWDNEKRNLYEILGNEFIISKNIFYEKDTEELISEYSKVDYRNNSPIKTFRLNYFSKINELKVDYSVYNGLSELMSYKNIILNRYEGKTFSIPLPNGKKYVVQNGTKVMRALTKISSVFGIEGFEEFRLSHSQLLNDKTIKGELCLSIHPLDYMTMSDNDCDWESCMNWRGVGDYRRGTVTMMNSPMVVVAYLKSSTDMNLFGEGSTWNNKKWRELFIINEEGIFAIKGYPFWNRDLEDIVLDWLVELTNKWGKFGEYYKDVIKFGNEEMITVNDKSYMFSMSCDTMYNDFYDIHKMCINKNATPINVDEDGTVVDKPVVIYFSGDDECMACGSIDSDFEGEYELLCESCYYPLRCCNCGEVIQDDEDRYEVDGEIYCSYCYNRLPVCACCGEKHNWNMIRDIYVAESHDKVLSRLILHVCDDCFDKPSFKIYKANYGNWYGDIEYCLLDDLTKEQRIQVFGYECSENDDECIKYIHERINNGTLYYINNI